MTDAPLLDDDGFVVEETGVRRSAHHYIEDEEWHRHASPGHPAQSAGVRQPDPTARSAEDRAATSPLAVTRTAARVAPANRHRTDSLSDLSRSDTTEARPLGRG